MSRTDKDVPYWVRLNNEGTLTDHDHRHLGREITSYRDVLDKDGNQIVVEGPLYSYADAIIGEFEGIRWHYGNTLYTEDGRLLYYNYKTKTLFTTSYGNYREPVIRRARLLHSAGRGKEFVQVGTYTHILREVVVIGYVADRCTAGEKQPRPDWRRRGARPLYEELPCTPELPADNRRLRWTSGMSKHKTSFSRQRYSAERVNLRDQFVGIAKHWNNGFEVDDWDESNNLAAQHRHSMAWDLY